MKRFLIVFLAFSFFAGLGFSQELKFDGYINSGVGLTINDEDGTDPVVRIFGVDSEQFAGRFRLNGAYTNEAKTAGGNFRLQLQGQEISTAAFGASFVYGWIKPLNVLNIKLGIVDDSTWETGGAILRDDQGEGAGILVRLTPVSGLDLGVGAYVWSQDSGSRNNGIPAPGNPQDWGNAKYTFMASYTMPKIFKFNLTGRTFSDTSIRMDTGAPNSGSNTARMIGELRLLAVDNLTAVLEAELDNLWDSADKFDRFKDAGLINLYETLAYGLGNFKFGLNAVQYFNNTDNTDMGLRFSPWASYAFNEGKIVPRLDLDYIMAGRWRTDGRYDRRTQFEASGVYDKDAFALNARPSVKFNLDSKTSFEIGDSVYYTKPVTGDNVLSNVFYTDLVIRF